MMRSAKGEAMRDLAEMVRSLRVAGKKPKQIAVELSIPVARVYRMIDWYKRVGPSAVLVEGAPEPQPWYKPDAVTLAEVRLARAEMERSLAKSD